jgi:aspartate racemase
LEASGVEFALIASNTPHHRFDAIVQGVSVPVINIIDVAAKESARIGETQVLILGTALTMSSKVFRNGFAKCGVEAFGPSGETARIEISRLIENLQLGVLEGAAERVSRMARATFGQFKTKPVVCLACTELPRAFVGMNALPVFEVDGVVYINTSVLHANAAFDLAMSCCMMPA